MSSAPLLLVEHSDLLPPPAAHTEPLLPATSPDPMRSGHPGCTTNPVAERCVAAAATRATLAHHVLCVVGAMLETVKKTANSELWCFSLRGPAASQDLLGESPRNGFKGADPGLLSCLLSLSQAKVLALSSSLSLSVAA